MTQKTELEQFREQLTKNQAWLDTIVTRRAEQAQEWYDDLARERTKIGVLSVWLDIIIEKQTKENKK